MSDRSPSSFFLTFEGIDGAGKSSHLASAHDYFARQGRDVVMTREPGGTPIAESLRNIILRDPMDPLTEALMIFAARRDHVVNVIAPALKRGNVVICDRFTDSTFAYQGSGRAFPAHILESLESWVHDDLQPDLTLWLDIPPHIAAGRLAGAREPDRFESEHTVFFDRVRRGYAARALRFPARIRQVDAEGTQHEIWKRIEHLLEGIAGENQRW